ncbi:hypothetical protein F0U62_21080 [Cystobacter fuscus]|uniref:hypothetical protein n=1 Tax=Cystobacter fuscus TaxID=43 RepID=UPI002B2C420D|nr:hypothetical protein F0U62_21080 [Cystobacter fuscus]
MLKLNQQQMAGLECVWLLKFEEHIFQQVVEAFPTHYRVLGTTPLRATIHLGFTRAGSYGFRFKRSLRTYVDLMFMLGSGFDTDPQLPWAAAALANPLCKDEVERTDLLFSAANAYLMNVTGPSNEHLLDALVRARTMVLSTGLTVEEVAPPLLQVLMPTKYDKLGPEGIARLLQHGRKAAARYGITAADGVTLYVTLMFIMGASFDEDPLAPWAASILTDPTIPDEHARAKRLHAVALSTMEAWFEC